MAGLTYRGMDHRTDLVRFGLPAIAAGIVLGATLPGAVSDLVAADPAQLPWLFERLFAWMAYLAMGAAVVWGLLLSSRMLDRVAHRPVTLRLHQDLSVVALGLAAVHGALLAADATMPFSVVQIVLPGAAPHAPLAVGAGQASLYVMALVALAYRARGRIGPRAWRAVHALTPAAFAGATVHGIAAGTDSGTAWAQWVYLASLTAVAFLAVYRVVLAVADRRTRGRATG